MFKAFLIRGLLVCLALELSACMVLVEAPENPIIIITESRHVGAFSSIEMHSDLPLEIQKGNEYAIYLTSDESLLAYFSTRNVYGTLILNEPAGYNIPASSHWVVVTPDLQKVTQQGWGLITLPSQVDFPNLSLEMNGAGKIRFEGTAGRLAAEINGSGNIELSGYCDFFQGDANGSGHVLGANLLTPEADLQSRGSGDILIGLDHQAHLKLQLSGSGQVEWWGDPAVVKYAVSGSGKIVEHRETLFKKSAMNNSPKLTHRLL